MLVFVIILSTLTMGTSLRYFLIEGQLGQYLKWGQSHQVTKVVKEFNKDDVVVFNDVGWDNLPLVFRYDMSINPSWKWRLKESIPKRYMLKYAGKPNTYVESVANINDLKVIVQENDIDKIAIVKSNIEEFEFPMQKLIPLLQKRKWASLEKEVPLKNSTMYIFDVINQ